jgi:hypothetical protein
MQTFKSEPLCRGKGGVGEGGRGWWGEGGEGEKSGAANETKEVGEDREGVAGGLEEGGEGEGEGKGAAEGGVEGEGKTWEVRVVYVQLCVETLRQVHCRILAHELSHGSLVPVLGLRFRDYGLGIVFWCAVVRHKLSKVLCCRA